MERQNQRHDLALQLPDRTWGIDEPLDYECKASASLLPLLGYNRYWPIS